MIKRLHIVIFLIAIIVSSSNLDARFSAAGAAEDGIDHNLAPYDLGIFHNVLLDSSSDDDIGGSDENLAYSRTKQRHYSSSGNDNQVHGHCQSGASNSDAEKTASSSCVATCHEAYQLDNSDLDTQQVDTYPSQQCSVSDPDYGPEQGGRVASFNTPVLRSDRGITIDHIKYLLKNRQYSQLMMILKHKAFDPSYTDKDQNSLLHLITKCSSQKRDRMQLTLLLQQIDLSVALLQKNNQGLTPLHQAIIFANVETVRYFVATLERLYLHNEISKSLIVDILNARVQPIDEKNNKYSLFRGSDSVQVAYLCNKPHMGFVNQKYVEIAALIKRLSSFAGNNKGWCTIS